MMTRKTKQKMTGGALALTLALAMPAAYAQGTADTPPAPPAQTAPPAAAPPATATPPEATTPAIPAPDTPSPPKADHRFRIGPEVGLFLPTSSKTRSRFGSSWLSLGLGFGQIGPVTEKGEVALDLNLLYQSKNGNHALVVPVGVSYRVALSQESSSTPYAGVSADLALADIRSKPDNVGSGLQAGASGSAFVGVNFGNSAYLEARYLAISRIKGFDLSGLNLSAGYRF